MPSHGVEIIDGIPVILKGQVMHAFQPESVGAAPIILGSYISDTKKATWAEPTEATRAWLQTFRENLSPRSRK
jgi:hypothetical protein